MPKMEKMDRSFSKGLLKISFLFVILFYPDLAKAIGEPRRIETSTRKILISRQVASTDSDYVWVGKSDGSILGNPQKGEDLFQVQRLLSQKNIEVFEQKKWRSRQTKWKALGDSAEIYNAYRILKKDQSQAEGLGYSLLKD